MTKLGDKRVAIIGTGATAIQSVPRVAITAALHTQLPYLFKGARWS